MRGGACVGCSEGAASTHIRLFSRQARIGRQERGQRFSCILAKQGWQFAATAETRDNTAKMREKRKKQKKIKNRNVEFHL